MVGCELTSIVLLSCLEDLLVDLFTKVLANSFPHAHACEFIVQLTVILLIIAGMTEGMQFDATDARGDHL